jgi:hypothetical protein
MPYVELPDRWNLYVSTFHSRFLFQLIIHCFHFSRLSYISNPISDGGEIKSRPLDYARHTIVFFHAGTSSSAGLIKQQLDSCLAASFTLVLMDAPHNGSTRQDDKEAHTVEVRTDDFPSCSVRRRKTTDKREASS